MKRIGKIKRAVTFGLIFLLSINNFATSVANNDGSAFITKAEFDALKSSFQAQIDTYNQNIDSKIDQAIASYLSGIKISTENALNGCTSNLEYPLDFYMVDPDLEYLADWNTNGATPYWAPNWHIYFIGQRKKGKKGDRTHYYFHILNIVYDSYIVLCLPDGTIVFPFLYFKGNFLGRFTPPVFFILTMFNTTIKF